MQCDFSETPETRINEHAIQTFCPACGSINTFDTDAVDFLREVSFTTACDECEASIRFGLVEHEAYMMFATQPSQFKHGELSHSPVVGECLCEFCGLLFQDEGMYFAEESTSAFIGPMCYECLVSHYMGLFASGREGYIRILPYLQKYKARPTLWKKTDTTTLVKVQCPNCLVVNPLPDDFNLPERRQYAYTTYNCPNCNSDSYMTYVLTGKVLEVGLYE